MIKLEEKVKESGNVSSPARGIQDTSGLLRSDGNGNGHSACWLWLIMQLREAAILRGVSPRELTQEEVQVMLDEVAP